MTAPYSSDQRRAFPSAPDPRRYYAASAIEEARQRIVRAVARHEGPALVVGAVGTGKSTLLAVLAEQFEPRLSVVRLPGAQLCTRRALLQMILCELHLPYRHMDEGELRLSILEHLRGPAASDPKLAAKSPSEPSPSGRGQGEGARGSTRLLARPRRMLVLVDEADALPTRLLEELRVLTNVVAHGFPLVSLVLAGGPILEERFADPELDKFSQRLACRSYLAPFTREETFQYVRSQVSAVGVKPESWFDPEALAAIHAATGGAPRLVNQLGDQLVWMIEETGCQPLDAALVQQAWSDLQQLPAPWNTDAHSSLSSAESASVGDLDSVVEFGELDAAVAAVDPFALELDDFESLEFGADSALEVFPPQPASPRAQRPQFDDDLPASIPIAAARSRRHADLGDYAANIAAAEELVEQLDEFAMLELASDAPEPPAEPSAPAAAENPFAEPFEEEETLIDPYSGFESQLLRSAQQVLNRIDRTFAAELARCELRKGKPLTTAGSPCNESTPSPLAPAPLLPSPAPNRTAAGAPPARREEEIHQSKPLPAPLPLVPDVRSGVESAPVVPAAVIPGRQLRRLFTSLESGPGVRVRQG
jgi:type II secretory pathway predicted ATPase ExeA